MKKLSALLLAFELVALPLLVSAQVKINEFVANGTPEWVEFHNSSESADFIKDYFIDDDLDFASDSGSAAIHALTDLNTDSATFPFVDLTSFLNNSGDTVALFDASGVLLDSFAFGAMAAGNSMGRVPDATGDFMLFTVGTTTKGVSNVAASPTPTPIPSPTPTPTPTVEPTPSPEPSPTPIPTPTPEVSPTPTPEPTPTPTTEPSPSPSPNVTPTPVPTPTPEVSPTPVPTPSPEPSPSPEVTPTPTPEVTPTPEPTPTPTLTPSPTSSPTPTPTPTLTPSPLPSPSPSLFPSPTPKTINFPGILFSCKAIYIPMRIFGFTFFFPRITCINHF